MSKKGKLIIFSAPSGSGKTTIVKEIIKTDIPFGFSVSATSRAPRSGEINGRDYHFLSIEEFKSAISNNEFLEWEEVYENQFYGTLISEVEEKLDAELNVDALENDMGEKRAKKMSYLFRALKDKDVLTSASHLKTIQEKYQVEYTKVQRDIHYCKKLVKEKGVLIYG